MSGDGMVAVVRGLETGLAITVIDGNKRYTLAPSRVPNNDKVKEVQTSSTEPATVCCESTVQAVDGRYTSTYQMHHCNVIPTSPPVLTTEFPPQRPSLCPGQGNFEVGGSGSGETYAVTTKTNKFRGAMNWPDRNSVCSPRASHDVDVFASSLRKYPAASPDKSSEIVEKIVNYAMEKNGLKNQQPTRLIESDTIDPRTPYKADPFASRKLDASPTKLKKVDYSYKEFKFPKEYDIRFLRNISKRARESAKNACANSATHANSEIQAAVKMVSREVSTDPRPKPTRRTIAVPISPSSSTTQSEYQCPSRTEFLQQLELNLDCPKPVQSVSSCVDLDKRNFSVDNIAKTRSEENVANSHSNLLKKYTELVENAPIFSEKSKNFNNQTAKRSPSEFLKKINLELCKKLIRILECDLVEVLTYFIGCLKNGKEGKVTDEMKYILKGCDKLTDKQADDATRVLINDLKDILRPPKNSNEYSALSNSVHAKSNAIQPPDSCSTNIKENENNDLDDYTQLISQEIEEWLDNLNIQNTQGACLKQDMKKRLTLDIVDKYKYLESNPFIRSPDSNELERLKFEIYKCMNKLIGESYTEILQHAEDLLAKIRCLPLPLVTRTSRECSLQDDNTIYSNSKSVSTHSCITRSEDDETKEYTGQLKQYNNTLYIGKTRESTNEDEEITNCKPRKFPRKKWNNQDNFKPRQYKKASWNLATPRILSDNWPCQFTGVQRSSFINFSQKQLAFRMDNEQTRNSQYDKNQSNFASSLRELNEDYDDFIKEWVEKIPIIVTNAEDHKLAELARLGIFNGIWKAITKLNLDPNALNNSYYYQDVLDDEIEDLLSNLPQTVELVANKHGLKAQLLEKTRVMNENMKAIILPSCFKQQLMECLDHNLPKISIFDPLKEAINVYKMSIIEDYILLIRFLDEDNVKSNMYKDSLLKNIMDLADIINKKHKEKNSNSLNYVSEFVNALSNVPIPDRKNLEDEANEILLGNEVTGWLSALPLCDNVDIVEIRRYRNKLVKKIVEIEKQRNLLNCSSRVNLREDIRRQLRTLSLQTNDMKLVMEELLNRLKEIPKTQESSNHHQRELESYEGFKRFVPGCSTFMPFPEASEEGSSYMVVGGDIVKQVAPKYLQPLKEPTISEENWISMELTKRPRKLGWSQTQVTGPRQQIIEKPHTSLRYGQSVFEQNPVDTNFPREYPDFPGQPLYQPYEYDQNTESNKTVTHWNDIVKQTYKPEPWPNTPPSPNYGQPFKQEKQQSRHESLSYNQPLKIYQDNLRDDKIKNSPVSYPNDEALHMSRDETVIDNADVRRFILDKTTQPRTSVKSSPVNSILPARLPPENSFMDVSIKREKQSTVGLNKDVFSSSKVTRPSEIRWHPNQEQMLNDNEQSQNPNLSWFRARNSNEEYIEDNQEKLPSWDNNATNPYPLNNRNSDIKDGNYPYENSKSASPSHTGQPIGFSTPQQPIIQEQPLRPRKRYQARVDSLRTNNVKRKLKMEDTDYGSDNEEELSCFCSRSHREDKSCVRVVPSCEDLYLDITHCVSDRMISCPHFY